MIPNTKCECGHQNHIGTVLCESCGKPLEDTPSTEPLEMRYDGVARRSQREKRTILDHVWAWLSSVKTALWIIGITLVGASLGSIYPQTDTIINAEMIDLAQYYRDNHGTIGYYYYLLGFADTYDSWWFRGLLVLIGTSLVVCSLDRVLPLYRALSKQQIRKHLQFITRQRVSWTGPVTAPGDDQAAEEWVREAGKQFRRKGYRVHIDGTALLAEKHRFSRWGPYINHIGLIIFLLALLARGIPGWSMDQYLAFLEGEPTPIPETKYYLENRKFSITFYDESEMRESFREQGKSVPKEFKTEAILYECKSGCGGAKPELVEVHRQDIVVNKPLEYKGLLVYQYDFAQTPQILAVRPTLRNAATGEAYGQIELSTKHPEESYTVGPYKLQLRNYYPSFGLDESGKPVNKLNKPEAPAYVFQITGPGLPEGGVAHLYFARPADKAAYGEDQINRAAGSPFVLAVQSMETDVDIANYTSYLNVRTERALVPILIGASIFVIGVVIGTYWQHRRVWLRIDDGVLSLGAHTNKNWYGLRHEVAQALSRSGVETTPQSLDRGGKKP
ncbi:cytochrome c biogenesis protein ResB [Paenibacillus thermoaerophilus]|uniref:Cytochrome c biogenesis protein ResB n=1 Tax=Paenibacillus thermoaerophilus TaxID=1215385 RepID=A0ABW2V7Y3_9BACL|nr:cytochrome c biogenesis protein ResB [Paenibacillus thermoaerophilus]TMV07511.1 cytochrome c biogenesis protein ResB [Paenibacillus thermoaerophilus]